MRQSIFALCFILLIFDVGNVLSGLIVVPINNNKKSDCQVGQSVRRLKNKVPMCSIISHRMFVTSATFKGDLDGLVGADEKCQAAADTAGISGTFIAWLSDSNTNAVDRLTSSNVQFMLIDGTVIAKNITDLIDGTIINPINLDENGQKVEDFYWTGTRDDGTTSSSCANWEVTAIDSIGNVGYSIVKDQGWTNYGSKACNIARRLLCIEP